jgi:hypothetical protein
VQICKPAELNLPDGQVMQPVEYVSLLLYLPAEHVTHSGAESFIANLPASQIVQNLELAELNKPAVHM